MKPDRLCRVALLVAALALFGSVRGMADDTNPDGGVKPKPPPPARSLSIDVVSANYGHSGAFSSCVVTPAIKQRCNGLSRCTVGVDDDLCPPPGIVPGGLILTLTVQYKCSPIVTERTAHADKPFRVVIDCSSASNH